MCVVDLDRCECSCHYMEGVHHMMPCCYGCFEHNLERLTPLAYMTHQREFHEKEEES